MAKAELAKQVGARVRARRQILGWTQAKLAADLELEEVTVRAVEAGRRGLSLKTLVVVAKVLRTSAASLLGETDDGRGREADEAARLVSEMRSPWRDIALKVLREIHGGAATKRRS